MKRYSSAEEEIRSLLSCRSQADPTLDARDVWEELTCYPVPSLRTVRRLIETIRAENEFGRRGQAKARGQRGQTKAAYVRSTYRMTNAEITEKLAELDRRADAFERTAVELSAETIATLDAMAKEANTSRHRIAEYAVRRYLAQQPQLKRPTDSPTH